MQENIREYLSSSNWFAIVASGLVLTSTSKAHAQSNIVPDNTLGNKSSIVNPDAEDSTTESIRGGAQRGNNLFHSFSEFNVGEGRSAYFVSPNANITNILSRITGNNISEIFGTLGIVGESQPNLFLINPNGIIFGEDASLDLGGSFVATTASGIQFGEQGFFNAINAEAPPLLTVQPSAFLFNQLNSGTIQNNSVAPAGMDISGSTETFGLRVPDGKTLSLLGGDINISGGLWAADGSIELAAISGTGVVGVDSADDQLNFNLVDDIVRNNIAIDGGIINTTGTNGGEISIYANNLDIVRGSTISTGIAAGFGSIDTQAGNITFDVSDTISLTNSLIFNLVSPDARGNSGNLSLQSQNLLITNGGQLVNGTSGQGNGGLIDIEVDNLVVEGFDNNGLQSSIVNAVQSGGIGDAGDINITTSNFSLANGAQLIAGTFGQGNGGTINITADTFTAADAFITEENNFVLTRIFNGVAKGGIGDAEDINITVRDFFLANGAQVSTGVFLGEGNGGLVNIEADTISLDGVGDNRTSSGIFSSVEGMGNAGDIEIITRELSIADGAQISGSVLAQGDGGFIDIKSDTIFLDGISSNGVFSGVFSLVGEAGIGDGGEILITTNEFNLSNGAQVNAITQGMGNSGNLKIETVNLFMNNGASIDTSAFSDAQAGEISINATDNIFLNQSSISSSGIVNNAGQIAITGQNLTFINDSAVSTSVERDGNAGTITLKADETFASDNSNVGSSVGNREENTAFGNVGKITIAARNIDFSNTAQIQASLFSGAEGNSGDVEIIATESIAFTGIDTGVFTNNELNSVGDASNILLFAPDIDLNEGSRLDANNLGDGNGGNISLRGDTLNLTNSSFIGAATTLGDGGNIAIQFAKDLVLDNRSNISARAFNDANGGNLNIDTRFIIAFPQNNDIIANAEQGQGGNININAESLFGIDARSSTPANDTNDIDASSEFGLDGEVAINTPDIDPTRGLDNLPANIVDASRLITRNCLSTGDEQLNEFVITGRGGLPNNPNELLSGDATISADWVSLPETNTNKAYNPLKQTTAALENPIIEAKGWKVKPDGTVVLVAENNSPDTIPWLNSHSCNSF